MGAEVVMGVEVAMGARGGHEFWGVGAPSSTIYQLSRGRPTTPDELLCVYLLQPPPLPPLPHHHVLPKGADAPPPPLPLPPCHAQQHLQQAPP